MIFDSCSRMTLHGCGTRRYNMPTISFSFEDFQNLLGKKIKPEDLAELLAYAKGDLEEYDKSTDEVKVDFGDTNLPYVWSVEGVTRLLKGILNKETGLPKLQVHKGPYKVSVDKSLAQIRPYIAAFVVKECKMSDYFLKQIIQLQEKLCENFGVRRKKVAIGVYRAQAIQFPVSYTAVLPNKVSFVPLEFKKAMTLKEILEEHPKGLQYAWILQGQVKYPLLQDAVGQVLSFPPIINSNETGKVTEKDTELFFECTGEDEAAVNLACTIFAYALADRGCKIYSVDIKYANKKEVTPVAVPETIKLNKAHVEKVLGIALTDNEIKSCLKKMRYEYAAGKVIIPAYRKDIMHEVDVIEDIGIAYGYDKIEASPLTTFTIGSSRPLISFADTMRELLIGLGFQEVMRSILSSKSTLSGMMETQSKDIIELQDPTSENFSAIRSWLLPIVMDVLSRNKHVDFPQNVFEQGLVTVNHDGKIMDYEKLAGVASDERVDYTSIRQVVDVLLQNQGIDYKIIEAEHPSFIEGRVGKIIVRDIEVGILGEINPKVIVNFGLDKPVAAFELNLSELFRVLKNESVQQ